MKMAKSRDTVGKISSDLLLKEPESTDPIEIEREMHSDYEKNINECVNQGLKDFSGDFFVVVITKKEPLMVNVLRNYFFARSTCPTPDYDQAAYHFKRSANVLEFLWVIPSKYVCMYLRENSAEVVKEEWELLNFVLKFYDNTLLGIAKKLNSEADNSNIIV